MGVCTSSYKKNNKIQPLVIPNDEEVVDVKEEDEEILENDA